MSFLLPSIESMSCFFLGYLSFFLSFFYIKKIQKNLNFLSPLKTLFGSVNGVLALRFLIISSLDQFRDLISIQNKASIQWQRAISAEIFNKAQGLGRNMASLLKFTFVIFMEALS